MWGQWLDLWISVGVVLAESKRATTAAATSSDVTIGRRFPSGSAPAWRTGLGRSAG